MAIPSNRPTDAPEWNTGGANRTEPTPGAKILGNEHGKAPASDIYNWLFNMYYQWQQYQDGYHADLYGSGIINPPDVADAAGPIFTISEYSIVLNGKRLDVAADTFSPTPTPYVGAKEYRIDAIVATYTESTNSIVNSYIEDIFSVTLTGLQRVVAFIIVDNNAVYTIDKIVYAPKAAYILRLATVYDGQSNDIPADEIGIGGLQSIIDVFSAREGNNIPIRIIADDYGKNYFSSESGAPLTIKSGIDIDFGGAHIFPPAEGEAHSLHELIRFQGTTENGTISAGNLLTCTTAGFSFYDYGQLSSIKISAGPNAGSYFIRDIIDYQNAELVDTNRDDVSLMAGAVAFDVEINHARIRNFTIDASRAGNDFGTVGDRAILAKYTRDCIIEDASIFHDSGDPADDLHIGIYLERNNYDMKLIRPKITGYLDQGIAADDGSEGCENLSITGHFIDLTGAAWDILISGAGSANAVIASGQNYGNISVPATIGWKGYPETTEHNSNGTHPNSLLGNALDGGDGLPFDVQVDDDTIEVNGSNKLAVKEAGITYTHIHERFHLVMDRITSPQPITVLGNPNTIIFNQDLSVRGEPENACLEWPGHGAIPGPFTGVFTATRTVSLRISASVFLTRTGGGNFPLGNDFIGMVIQNRGGVAAEWQFPCHISVLPIASPLWQVNFTTTVVLSAGDTIEVAVSVTTDADVQITAGAGPVEYATRLSIEEI